MTLTVTKTTGVDLKAMPFYLSDKDIQWVNETIEHMTLEEKIGQLFIHLENQEIYPSLWRI